MTVKVKVLVLSLFVSLVTSMSTAQKPLDSQDNFYAIALSACVNKEEQDYGKLGLGRDYLNVIVERDTFTTSPALTDFGKIKVEYLDANELRERYKKTGKKIPILAVRPLQNKDGKLIINILDYWFSYFETVIQLWA